MAPRYAEKTNVSTGETRAEIERVLSRYGAQRFTYGQNEDQNEVLIGFRLIGRVIRFRIPMPSRPTSGTKRVGVNQYRARQITMTDGELDKQYEQSTRQRWRAILLIIKAKLEAVEAGIVTLEDEFLAQTMLSDGSTVGEWVGPQIDEVYRTGGMPALLPGVENKALSSGGQG